MRLPVAQCLVQVAQLGIAWCYSLGCDYLVLGV